MDILTGMALSLSWKPGWDHTYVASSSGKSWACFGRSAGGLSLDSGLGSDSLADCLAYPNDTAGIRYGVTGVCQQASNRILYGTSAMVSKAGGYALSLMMYGPYGLGHWLRRDSCVEAANNRPSGLSRVMETDTGDLDLESADFAVSAFVDHVRSTVGDINSTQEVALRATQLRLRDEQSSLATLLEAGKISGPDYLARVEILLSHSIFDTQQILGDEKSRTLFGEAANHPAGLIDPETFLGTRAR